MSELDPNTEDLVLDYLRRAPATTKEIASHYGMTWAQTRRGMISMELAGKVEARGHYWRAINVAD